MRTAVLNGSVLGEAGQGGKGADHRRMSAGLIAELRGKDLAGCPFSYPSVDVGASGAMMNMARLSIVGLGVIALVAFSCSRSPDPVTPAVVQGPVKVRWDTEDSSARWTRAAMDALDSHGAPLVSFVPEDIGQYCPGYEDADPRDRKAFWINLIASLSYHESTWRPDVSGGDGRWHGLLQISPATARGYGCVAGDAEALKDGALNLACGIRIMAETVPRDGVISRDMDGIAADWGPFHQERKRNDIKAYTQGLPYCQ